MSVKRRQFLQFAGSTLFTLGLNQLSIQQAQSKNAVPRRKLALLVGIDDYPSECGLHKLRGCVNDVEIQRHLLKYRYGFQESDIYTLTNSQATRQGILEGFQRHLIGKAQPGDLVLFHYSGHGSQIVDPDPIFVNSTKDKTGLNGILVPFDVMLPPGYPNQGGVVKNIIMGHTLFLLMSALKTENVTVVLDSCFSGSANRANGPLKRTMEGGIKLFMYQEERVFQDHLLSQLNLNREKFVQQYRAGIAKGVVITATNDVQEASEAQFGQSDLDRFSTGAFTYNLAQSLWQQTSSVENAISYVNQKISQEYGQTPSYNEKFGSGYGKQPIYFTSPHTASSDAVITEVQGNRVKLWLGGTNPIAINQGTMFVAIGEGSSSAKVTTQHRQGLAATATVSGVVKEGTLLRQVKLG